jgi:hypothetical protein
LERTPLELALIHKGVSFTEEMSFSELAKNINPNPTEMSDILIKV